ncbi:1,4-dihydroxy-2-naphthoate polyprenyltransferase [Aliicoccus persicus]|uniref:1,4-dihydroxy-2-naphthoate octaprenyltransferase n=1 Tax=Aliicoccus persicus TaxID=930138 RepID=A0A662Z2A4_9STAP|nr:1,4-dihydroxy-2-naphthoate polyprenyltransferase [Aliicoccus persicus]SEV88194.1 1,4-dihydroxy-2-naphthoate prenyltransferase [Aliicoccus persicus]
MQGTETLTGFKKYINLTRPHTLTASFVPILVGSAAALVYDTFRFDIFICMLIATLLIQSATNMFNEYFDYKRGLDSKESVGIAGAIVRNGMSPRQVFTIAVAFYVIAALVGLYITFQSSIIVLIIGLIGMAVGYFYTGGPFPISWTPFGEIFAGLFMGTILIVLTFYIHLGEINSFIILLSLPVAITIGLLNMANNIRDRVKDKRSGRRTYVILVGKNTAILTAAIALFIGYVIILYIGTIHENSSVFLLLPLLSIPIAVETIKLLQQGNKPIELIPAMASMGKLNTVLGLLLTIGLLLQAIFY